MLALSAIFLNLVLNRFASWVNGYSFTSDCALRSYNNMKKVHYSRRSSAYRQGRRVDSSDVKERLDSWVDRERVLCPVSSDRE